MTRLLISGATAMILALAAAPAQAQGPNERDRHAQNAQPRGDQARGEQGRGDQGRREGFNRGPQPGGDQGRGFDRRQAQNEPAPRGNEQMDRRNAVQSPPQNAPQNMPQNEPRRDFAERGREGRRPNVQAPSAPGRPAGPDFAMRGPNNGMRGPDMRGPGQRRDFSAFHRNFNAPRRFHVSAYRRPAGWYSHRWVYGEFLPSLFWAPEFWLTDYFDYGLMPPPPGTVWVRDGDDALLIDRYTGEIIQVDYNVFY